MQKKKRWLFSVVVIIFLQGCGSLETVSGDQQLTYNHDFDKMVEVVERAMRAKSLEVNFAEKSDDGDRYYVMFHAISNINTQIQRKDQGEVVIERISDNETLVTITNPEYHYSLPSHHRKKYDKELTEEIEKILNQ